VPEPRKQSSTRPEDGQEAEIDAFEESNGFLGGIAEPLGGAGIHR